MNLSRLVHAALVVGAFAAPPTAQAAPFLSPGRLHSVAADELHRQIIPAMGSGTHGSLGQCWKWAPERGWCSWSAVRPSDGHACNGKIGVYLDADGSTYAHVYALRCPR
jgi:hypothetical protein